MARPRLQKPARTGWNRLDIVRPRKKESDMLKETQSQWAPLFRAAKNSTAPAELYSILEKLSRIGGSRSPETFGVLVTRLRRFAGEDKVDPVLVKFMQQLRLDAQKPKAPKRAAQTKRPTPPQAPPRPVHPAPSQTLAREADGREAPVELKEAYRVLNSLSIPAEQYAELRRQLIRAQREGKLTTALTVIQRRFAQKEIPASK